jgi:hypothetical protein
MNAKVDRSWTILMKRLASKLLLGLALAACAGPPVPEQPTEAKWVPCGGVAAHSYARCIRHIAVLADAGRADVFRGIAPTPPGG